MSSPCLEKAAAFLLLGFCGKLLPLCLEKGGTAEMNWGEKLAGGCGSCSIQGRNSLKSSN